MKISAIAQENSKLSKEGNSIRHEFVSLVNTFNRALNYKRNKRVYLLQQIESLKQRQQESLGTIRTLAKNISIYNQNDQMLADADKQLKQRDQLIKEKYESLLAGTLQPDQVEALKTENPSAPSAVVLKSEGKSGRQNNKDGASRNKLIERKREYVEKLDHTFRKFEGDLSYVDEVRTKLAGAIANNEHTKEQAIDAKTAMESNYESLLKEHKKFEIELEITLQEEHYLLQEYRKVIDPVTSQIVIKQETDQMLFNLLTAEESDQTVGPTSENGSDNNKYRLSTPDQSLITQPR